MNYSCDRCRNKGAELGRGAMVVPTIGTARMRLVGGFNAVLCIECANEWTKLLQVYGVERHLERIEEEMRLSEFEMHMESRDTLRHLYRKQCGARSKILAQLFALGEKFVAGQSRGDDGVEKSMEEIFDISVEIDEE